MSLVRAFVREARTLTSFPGVEDPSRIPGPAEGAGSYAGRRVTEASALQLPAFWSCVTLLTDTISMLPFAGFRKMKKARQLIEPDPPLLRNPHAEYDPPDWVASFLISLYLRGNGYGWIIERDALQFARQVQPLHPDDVTPRRDKSTGRLVYRVRGEKKLIAAEDMMHVRGLRLPGPRNFLGLSPVEYARQAIGLGLAAEEFGARFFGDGAHPSGVFETTETVKEETGKRFLAKWRRDHGNRQRTPAILPKGMKWQSISISPNEAQFLETRKFQRAEIAGFFRVPPHMIGDVERSTSWGTGIEEQVLGLITFTLQPWIVRLETAFSKLLPAPEYVKFNVASLLRGRLIEQYQAFLMARNGGWLSVNEIRELLEREPVDGGDSYMQPLNYGPLGLNPLEPKVQPWPPSQPQDD